MMSNDPNKRRPEVPRPTPARPTAPLPKDVTRDPAAPRPAPPQVSKRAPTAPSTGSANARPVRPQAPTRPATGQRLEGVLEDETRNVQSIESLMPSGLSVSTYLPNSRRDPEVMRRKRLRNRYQFRQTVIPSAVVLSATTLLMAGGWFILDPSSALRDNALGTTIPLTLFVLSLAFGVASALLIVQAKALRKQVEQDGAH